MWCKSLSSTLLILAVLNLLGSAALAVEEIPDRYMVSKGGVLYPHTGDDSPDKMYQTPPDATTLFPPGTLVGVLPADCNAVSSGTLGDYYRCDHNFVLKQEVLADGRTVYRVIPAP